MGTLWPEFTARFGGVFGLAFALEGFSFFAEAIFIGIYVYGWSRMPARLHFAAGVPIVVTGLLGSMMVIAVNRWMNHPQGFRLVDGRVTDVRPVYALFGNGYFWHELVDIYLAAFVVVAAGRARPECGADGAGHGAGGTDQPPVNLVRFSFQAMVGIGSLFALPHWRSGSHFCPWLRAAPRMQSVSSRSRPPRWPDSRPSTPPGSPRIAQKSTTSPCAAGTSGGNREYR